MQNKSALKEAGEIVQNFLIDTIINGEVSRVRMSDCRSVHINDSVHILHFKGATETIAKALEARDKKGQLDGQTFKARQSYNAGLKKAQEIADNFDCREHECCGEGISISKLIEAEIKE